MKTLRALALVIAAAISLRAFGQDAELTNYKSGISLTWGGTKGVDYMEEYLYFDKVISDRKVVYIKSGTSITMSHNDRNVAGDDSGSDAYEAVGTNVGVINYKPDGDQHWSLLDVDEWHTYSSPITFGGLNYGLFGASGTSVVGTTGRVGSLTRDTKQTTYYRGMLDSVGDEWHILTVADDDSARTSNVEYSASDGRVFMFVVNPKTPGVTWRVTGTGQFYTTRPKKYFIPIIYDQTTYIQAGSSGTVTVEIRDINEGNISYRINAGTTVNVGTSSTTLTQDAFNSGSNTLEYWITATPEYTKTRTVVKNPAFPSAGEEHGDRFWVSAAYWTNDVVPRINGTKPNNWSNWLTNWGNATHSAANYRNGKRNNGSGFADAIIARYYGMSRTRSGESVPNSQWAKRSLFEFIEAVDPVGLETNGSNVPMAAKEWFDRGYTDINARIEAAGAYDVLIGYYRTDQGYADGISPIEDHYIRDAFAGYIHVASLFMAGYIGPAYDDFNSAGMWETSRNVSAALIAMTMPAYTSPVFGTCGMDGNTTTYDDAPFPDQQITWADLFLRNAGTVSGFPNQDKKVGVEDYMITADGNFTDRPGYTSTTNMGHVHAIWWCIQKLFNPDHDFTRAEAYLQRAATGQLYGLKQTAASDKDPVTNYMAACLNPWFPQFKQLAHQPLINLTNSGSTSNNTWNRQTLQGGPFYVIWYDNELPAAAQGAETVAMPTFSPAGGSYSSAQSVTISGATSGVTYRYTTDGTIPSDSVGTVYSGPISIAIDTTLRAIGYKAGQNNSAVRTEAYTIGQAQLNPPSINGVGAHMFAQTVSITPPAGADWVYYTTDGSDPDNTDTLYTAPFLLSSSATVKTIAYGAGYDPSPIASSSLTIGTITSSTNVHTTLRMPERTGQFRISFTARSSQDSANVLFGLADDLPEIFAYGNYAVVARQNGGTFSAYNSTAYAAVNTVAALGNTDYAVVLDVDQTARTYSMTVDGTIVATDYGFREAAPTGGINYVVVWNGTGTVTLDDFTFGIYGESSTPIPPGRDSSLRNNLTPGLIFP